MFERKSHTDHGQRWAVAVAMLDGPKTFLEIIEHFNKVKRRFGFFDSTTDYSEAYFKSTLQELLAKDWVIKKEGKYALTNIGKKEAEKAYGEIKRSRQWINDNLLNPTAVSKVTVVIHFILALLKMPIGILSGSIGLLNDGVDTLLDGLSSVLVYLGLKYDFENKVNYILIAVMFGTGFYTLFQAIRRFFVPIENNIDWLTFTAVILSGLISLVLMIYQRYVGIKTGRFSLITQSVDSRNHLIVAGSVVVGMLASLVNFQIIDIFVGLIVAVLILKGALDLVLDILNEDNEDSKYDMFVIGRNFYKKRLKKYCLTKIAQEKRSYQNWLEEIKKELDFNDNITLEGIGMHRVDYNENSVRELLDTFIKENLVIKQDDFLTLTNTGCQKVENSYKLLNLKTIINYFVLLPASIVTFILSNYIILGIMTYIPSFDLWQKVDQTLFNLGFPFLEITYNYTLFNLIHLLIGIVIFSFAAYQFIEISMQNKEHRDPSSKNPLQLITNGYYSQVRHPMYGYMVLINTALMFSLKSSLTMVIAILLAVVLMLNGVFEEKWDLIPLFGERYLEYKKEVPRLCFDTGMKIVLFVIYIITVLGLLY
jgi:protein-S-isoprenylcysteine O-methyltransferase Ste14